MLIVICPLSESGCGTDTPYIFDFSAVNECDSSPCQNLGNCVDRLGYYDCECAAGFSGYNCEIHDYTDMCFANAATNFQCSDAATASECHQHAGCCDWSGGVCADDLQVGSGGGCFYAVLFISSVDVIKSAKGAYLEISSASKH